MAGGLTMTVLTPSSKPSVNNGWICQALGVALFFLARDFIGVDIIDRVVVLSVGRVVDVSAGNRAVAEVGGAACLDKPDEPSGSGLLFAKR
jgi:hypothetical protein